MPAMHVLCRGDAWQATKCCAMRAVWGAVQVAQGGTLMHHVEDRARTRRADVLHTSEDEARYYFKVPPPPHPFPSFNLLQPSYLLSAMYHYKEVALFTRSPMHEPNCTRPSTMRFHLLLSSQVILAQGQLRKVSFPSASRDRRLVRLNCHWQRLYLNPNRCSMPEVWGCC